MTTIRDYGDLQTDRRYEYYVRSASDPRYLIAGHTGEVYLRADGEPWEFPAWEIRHEFEDDGVTIHRTTRKSRAAWFDSKQYTSKKKVA